MNNLLPSIVLTSACQWNSPGNGGFSGPGQATFVKANPTYFRGQIAWRSPPVQFLADCVLRRRASKTFPSLLSVRRSARSQVSIAFALASYNGNYRLCLDDDGFFCKISICYSEVSSVLWFYTLLYSCNMCFIGQQPPSF